jgi:hypothetical protein
MARVEVPVFKNGQWEKGVGELVNIVEQKEPWSEYYLEDGTIIRTKNTALQIIKMEVPGPDGKPTYSMQVQPNTVIIPKVEDE